jgi:hypothetical protein
MAEASKQKPATQSEDALASRGCSVIKVLTDAFPASLEAKVIKLAPSLTKAALHPPSEPFLVYCEGTVLKIPNRNYYTAMSDEEFATWDETEQAIAACWFTRHHDGHTREAFLRVLPVYDSPWIIAYVVALCGEYVVEILNYVWAERNRFDLAALRCWLRENEAFYARTRRRIVSYWDCYNRSSAPLFENFVGGKLMAFFDECLTGQQKTA